MFYTSSDTILNRPSFLILIPVRTRTVMEALQAVENGQVDGALIDQLACGNAITGSSEPLANTKTGLQIAQVLVQSTNFGVFFTPNRTGDRLEECANLVVRNMEKDIYLSVQELSSAVEVRQLSASLLQVLSNTYCTTTNFHMRLTLVNHDN